jgi:hypothetical protein
MCRWDKLCKWIVKLMNLLFMYDIMVVLYRLGYPERLCSKFHSAVT